MSDKRLAEEAKKTLEDFNAAKEDAEGFFTKHKKVVIVCGIAIVAIIVVFAIL